MVVGAGSGHNSPMMKKYGASKYFTTCQWNRLDSESASAEQVTISHSANIAPFVVA